MLAGVQASSSGQTSAVLAYLCFHEGLGGQLTVAMRQREVINSVSSEQPAACSHTAYETEAVLRHLAAIAATPEPPEGAGTAHGGRETVLWVVAAFVDAALRWQMSAAKDRAGDEELAEATGSLSAALEVTCSKPKS